MRSILIFGMLTVSTSLLACPDLAGVYQKCQLKDSTPSDRSSFSISQAIERKYWNFSFKNTADDDLLYRADGKYKYEQVRDPETDMTLSTSSVVYCSKTQLITKLEMKLDGMLVGRKTTSYSKAGNQLTIETKVFDGDEEEIHWEICE